jgi:hypothetical protein
MSGQGHGAVFAVVVFGAVVLGTAGVVAPAAGGGEDVDRALAAERAARLAESVRAVLADASAAWFERLERPPLRLYGPGVIPEEPGETDPPSFPLSGVLLRDELGLGAAWKGPYGDPPPCDPWGRAFIVRIPGPTGPVLVLSAGEDGVIDSGFGSSVSPRDVGVVLLR